MFVPTLLAVATADMGTNNAALLHDLIDWLRELSVLTVAGIIVYKLDHRENAKKAKKAVRELHSKARAATQGRDAA